jgi:hypothetical protein
MNIITSFDKIKSTMKSNAVSHLFDQGLDMMNIHKELSIPQIRNLLLALDENHPYAVFLHNELQRLLSQCASDNLVITINSDGFHVNNDELSLNSKSSLKSAINNFIKLGELRDTSLELNLECQTFMHQGKKVIHGNLLMNGLFKYQGQYFVGSKQLSIGGVSMLGMRYGIWFYQSCNTMHFQDYLEDKEVYLTYSFDEWLADREQSLQVFSNVVKSYKESYLKFLYTKFILQSKWNKYHIVLELAESSIDVIIKYEKREIYNQCIDICGIYECLLLIKQQNLLK